MTRTKEKLVEDKDDEGEGEVDARDASKSSSSAKTVLRNLRVELFAENMTTITGDQNQGGNGLVRTWVAAVAVAVAGQLHLVVMAKRARGRFIVTEQ
jgi:hypothetical protein